MNIKKTILTSVFILCLALNSNAQGKVYNNDDFIIKSVEVIHESDFGVSVWEIKVKGVAGKTTPKPNGQLDGAPVLGYVFPTSLKPTDVGFNQTDGIVALALTSHPDFDDTPLWDEDMNGDTKNAADGVIWHPHWVILHEDKRVPSGLAVKQFEQGNKSVKLPLTNPGMPMYMDSPGYPTVTKGDLIRVVVPDYRINNQYSFKFDGVAAFMKVNTSIQNQPMLGVYDVYSVASGDLSLPYSVKQK